MSKSTLSAPVGSVDIYNARVRDRVRNYSYIADYYNRSKWAGMANIATIQIRDDTDVNVYNYSTLREAENISRAGTSNMDSVIVK